jgi:hypothetical protein
MTVLVTADLPASRADMEAVGKDRGDVYDDPPDGLIVHIATDTGDAVGAVAPSQTQGARACTLT